jgi:8-oxo-dGTP pyrophosphatase MutT (NUDIX family)
MEALARPAATIMLLRDGPDSIEVFMVVRHQAIEFAGGALVFPGGRGSSRARGAMVELPAACLSRYP